MTIFHSWVPRLLSLMALGWVSEQFCRSWVVTMVGQLGYSSSTERSQASSTLSQPVLLLAPEPLPVQDREITR